MKNLFTRTLFKEAAVEGNPIATVHKLEEGLDLIRRHCSDALWMVHTNRPLYRGDPNLTSIMIQSVDPSKTVRASQNTSNFYTSLFDKIPSWATWPKRSRSYICTNSKSKANQYAYGDEDILRLIPHNGVQIGVCEGVDIWDTEVGNVGKLATVNMVLEHQFSIRTYEDLQAWIYDMETKIKQDTHTAVEEHQVISFLRYFQFDINLRTFSLNTILPQLDQLYNPLHLGMQKHTTISLESTTTPHECWVGGPCIVIPSNLWSKVQEQL